MRFIIKKLVLFVLFVRKDLLEEISIIDICFVIVKINLND